MRLTIARTVNNAQPNILSQRRREVPVLKNGVLWENSMPATNGSLKQHRTDAVMFPLAVKDATHG